ncbi:hypothetical protein FACS1894111_11820 [Clostridia bacterium]|nr:hypothetical protein FACS1894111_11820 [Clostridia bacterium]
MSTIKPVSDLQNKEYEKLLAWQKLKSKLDEGRRSGEENGWISSDEARTIFEERYHV